MTPILVSEFVDDIVAAAQAIDAPYNRAIIQRNINAYDAHFSRTAETSLAIRTTTQKAPSLSFRYVDFATLHNPLSIAYESGLLSPQPTPLHKLLPEIKRVYPGGGFGADFNASRGFEKLWMFLTEGPLTLDEVLALENIPPAVYGYKEHFARFGFENISVFALDYAKQSMNLYFMVAPPGSLVIDTIATQLADLGFPVPEDDLLALASQSGCVAYTFTWHKPEVQRICHYFPIPKAHFPVGLHPRLQTFVEAVPFRVMDEMFIHGVSFAPNGTYHKPEAEYNGAMMNVFSTMMGTIAG